LTVNPTSSGKKSSGHATNGNKSRVLALETLRTIHDHITSFPVQVSHYSAQEFRYSDSRLNVQKMFDLYKDKYPDSKVSYKFYVKSFKDNFYLSSQQPQTNICINCEELMAKIKSPMLTEKAKRVANAEFMVHRHHRSTFYKAMKDYTEACQKEEHVLGLCFDYKQNLPLKKYPHRMSFI
jgi:hypothetical protein